MKKNRIAAALAATIVASGPAAAASFDDELAAIKARLNALEAQVRDQNAVILEKDREISELKAASNGEGDNASGGWMQRVEIGGAVEIEANHHSPYVGDNTSDVVVATAEIGIAAQINDWTSAEITLLYEEDDTPLEVDVAAVTFADPDAPWFVVAGRQYVPFGEFESNLVSDPLTLAIGETRESAVLAGIESNGFTAAAYVFNGDNKENGDDRIDNFGATAGYSNEGENAAFSVSVGYINDIGDSENLQEAINDNLGNNDIADHVPGWTAAAQFSSGPFVVIGEYVTATDSFTMAELPFRTGGAQPSAFNVEAGYNFTLAGKPAVVALAYQGSDEALALELPEKRIAAAIAVEVMDATTLSFEWARDDDYGVADGGTGERANTATAQLAVEF
ncbi:MAG: LbtU family siderophore porin [Gammaproteobacteria bacterium]|nr:LbtU family siderophore porin [Gammaproteobacteria bacterium]